MTRIFFMAGVWLAGILASAENRKYGNDSNTLFAVNKSSAEWNIVRARLADTPGNIPVPPSFVLGSVRNDCPLIREGR